MNAPTLIIQDGFLPDPDVTALHLKLTTEASFSDQVSPGDGHAYPNICNDHQPLDLLKSKISEVHGGKEVDIAMSCFRLGIDGELDDTFCHADGIYAQRAGVLYLTKGLDNAGGTAFWRHVSGLDQVPSESALVAAGYDPVRWHQWMTGQTRFGNEQAWTLAGLAGLKFNRFISYPTAAFHSRHPNHIAAPFGSTAATGRLIWVCFYNLA